MKKKKKKKSNESEPQSQNKIIHFFTYMSCLKIVACKVYEKTVTQNTLKRQKNGQLKGRIIAMSPILNPKIQQFILSLCIPSFKVLT